MTAVQHGGQEPAAGQQQMSDGRALLFIHEWNAAAYERQRVRDGEVPESPAPQNGGRR